MTFANSDVGAAATSGLISAASCLCMSACPFGLVNYGHLIIAKCSLEPTSFGAHRWQGLLAPQQLVVWLCQWHLHMPSFNVVSPSDRQGRQAWRPAVILPNPTHGIWQQQDQAILLAILSLPWPLRLSAWLCLPPPRVGAGIRLKGRITVQCSLQLIQGYGGAWGAIVLSIYNHNYFKVVTYTTSTSLCNITDAGNNNFSKMYLLFLSCIEIFAATCKHY
jgi:hypothetical protein